MNNAIVYSRARSGINAPLIQIEVHLSKGLPGFAIVGLPETAIKESRDRVRSAILNTGYDMPGRKIIVNLAPADLPKEGARFDLAIALGILAASGQLIIKDLSPYEFAAELGLSGDLRPVQGILPFAMGCKKDQRTLIVARANGTEAALTGARTLVADHLIEVTGHFCETASLMQIHQPPLADQQAHALDLADIHGQQVAKRALIIAASGGHSLLMQGPPGTGKSMLAQRLPTLLPSLTEEEALAVAALQSISQQGFDSTHWRQRPFRSPHHTASAVALVGGGSTPHPGEISLAHHGILFLDELPEFPRKVLETLREPIESGVVHISRAAQAVSFPAQFQLICAMNPCPCGYLTDPKRECRCTPAQIEHYQQKISGPLLDRIDMHLEIPRVPVQDMVKASQNKPTSAEALAQVVQARALQLQRQGCLNTQVNPRKMPLLIEEAAQTRLLEMIEKMSLSGRSYYRILKLARTIADLESSEWIRMEHMQEAFMLRVFDFKR
jgi:magnesium chelatase family protein